LASLTFLGGLASAAALTLAIALVTAVAVAFLLPARIMGPARVFLEWAAALSGAGFFVLMLAWLRLPVTGSLPSGPAQAALYGAVAAASYLPFAVQLLLRALEPQWPAALASRALGLPLRAAAATVFQAASADLRAVCSLYTARLAADGTFLLAVLTGNFLVALIGAATAMMLFPDNLAQLAKAHRVPIYPPLFGPLPELPPSLHPTPRLSAPFRTAIGLSLLAVLAVTGLTLGGLNVLHHWAYGNSQPLLAQGISGVCAVFGTSTQCVLPLLAISASVVWIMRTKQPNRVPGFRRATSMAAVSPAVFAYPAVAAIDSSWRLWLSLATIGLIAYLIIQKSAARAVYALIVRQSHYPGENTAAAATEALGLAIGSPLQLIPSVSQVFSTGAAWFGAAALLTAVSHPGVPSASGHALVWGLMSALLQGAGLWIRSSAPQPQLKTAVLSASLEALTHETA
jgi:hypothetical protein